MHVSAYINMVKGIKTMKLEEFNKLTGMEKMRQIVKALNNCNESFLDQFRFEELIKIYSAWLASGWTFLPDQWTERQVKEALRGIVPNWDFNEKPVYIKRATR